MDAKLKNICSDFHETLFTSLILYDNLRSITFNGRGNQEEIHFKYTEKTGKINNLYTKIYSNLETGEFSINKISEFFFVSNVSLFEDWFNEFQFNYYLNNKEKYPVKEKEIEKIKLKKIIDLKSLEIFWENEIRRHILDKNMSQNICQRLLHFSEHIMRLATSDIPFDLNQIYEISLSRNCLVHNK